ncbi:hypothetical protein BJ138DRAFT_1009461, partial [Hygrophoropsis aurantiaca]
IYETLGCLKLARKPELSYKLSTATQKADAINLGSQEDWEGCVSDVAAAEKKKKGDAVPVKIIIPDQYMTSLRAHMKKKPPTAAKGKKAVLLDLDNDDENQGEAGEAMVQKEKHWLGELEKALTLCQKCGPSKWCKVDKHGTHTHLTFHQRRGWLVALATETTGVSLKTPPKGNLFPNFHKVERPLASPENPVAAMNPYGYPHALLPPFQWPPPFMGAGNMYGVPPAAMPIVPAPTRTPDRRAAFSSSPPDRGDATAYPSVDDFLTILHIRHPRRGLNAYVDTFNKADFYDIDELVDLSEEQLSGPEFLLSAGNARFLLKEVKAEMRKVDQATRKKRARRE